MKAERLPQEGIVLEVIENLQEIIWGKIASGAGQNAHMLTTNFSDHVGHLCLPESVKIGFLQQIEDYSR